MTKVWCQYDEGLGQKCICADPCETEMHMSGPVFLLVPHQKAPQVAGGLICTLEAHEDTAGHFCLTYAWVRNAYAHTGAPQVFGDVIGMLEIPEEFAQYMRLAYGWGQKCKCTDQCVCLSDMKHFIQYTYMCIELQENVVSLHDYSGFVDSTTKVWRSLKGGYEQIWWCLKARYEQTWRQSLNWCDIFCLSNLSQTCVIRLS